MFLVKFRFVRRIEIRIRKGMGMSKFCHYGCYLRGCMGETREQAIDFLVEVYKQSREELERKTDQEINQLAVDLSDGETHTPHIREVSSDNRREI